MKKYEKLLYDYEDGLGTLYERLKEGYWKKNTFEYEGIFTDIDWLAPARIALEKHAPKNLRERIEKDDRKLLRIAEILKREIPEAYEYLKVSLKNVLPVL